MLCASYYGPDANVPTQMNIEGTVAVWRNGDNYPFCPLLRMETS